MNFYVFGIPAVQLPSVLVLSYRIIYLSALATVSGLETVAISQ
jgi:hypothetical protein